MMRLVSDSVPSIEGFMRRYNVSLRLVTLLISPIFPSPADISPPPSQLDLPAAQYRLSIGIPATIEHSSSEYPSNSSSASFTDPSSNSKWVAETTQSFITFMDALKLKYRAKDQLHPILQELVTGYARFKGSKEWEGRQRMVSW
jgi:ESCRT-I complex subunit VPS28